MIGLDTNILVRYLTLDDATQAKLAARVFDSLTLDTRGFVSLPVILELVCVLETSYELKKDRIIETIEALLATEELVLERSDTVRRAVHRFAMTHADFADCLIECNCNEAGCPYTLTFDRKAVAAGMRLLA
ncbi:MAG TPA: type II toxin-antitoxin system VapC family toxin [Candidatus Aquilonibacter sp.]|nr:type II toxin-antitoxin system VapC family toxin [Candidatus Aquilonibacter sp.]